MSQGPWSVKGIDPKARSAARDRAQQRGLTLGQYLNSLLLEEGGGPARIDEIDVGSLHTEQGAPEDMRRMSEEIDQLSRRLEASQARSARALAGVDKSVLGLMGKVDATAKAQLSALERVSRAMTDIETTQAALRTRIESVEAQGQAGATLDALRSLEASLGRLAETVVNGNDDFAREQAELRDLFEQKVSKVSERVDDVSRSLDSVVFDAVKTTSAGINGRVDQIETQMSAAERRMDGALSRLTDAASRFELFETKAERAVGDTTWRMERALEANLNRSRAMSKELLDRVDSIESQTRDAVGQLGDAVSRITDRLTRAERGSTGAISALERTVSDLGEQVSRGGSASAEIDQFKQVFQKRLDNLAEDLSRPINAVRADVERRIEESMRAYAPDVDRLERTVRHLQDKLQESEARSANAVEAMTAQVERMSRAVDERLRAVEGRDPERTIDDVRREMQRLADNIEARLSGAEMAGRNTIGAVDDLREDIADVARKMDGKLQDSERRNVAAFGDFSDQIAQVAERLQRRQEDGMSAITARMEEVASAKGATGEDIARHIDRLEKRIVESEQHSGNAIVQLCEQLARSTERLQTQHDETRKTIESRFADAGHAHESRLNDTIADMARRLEELREQQASGSGTIQNTLSSIALRVANLEDSAMVSTPPARAEASAASDDDQFLVIDDFRPPASMDPLFEPEAQPTAIAQPDILQADIDDGVFEDESDIVGVEPPPFDRAADAHLFSEEKPAEAAAAETAAPANNIDDLLDTDDVVLAPGPSPAGSHEYVADLPVEDPGPRADREFLAEARRAAMQGRRITAANGSSRKGVSAPLMAAGALALAVAGGGAYTVMRGKQDAANDSFAKLDPAAPKLAEGDPAAAAAMLFHDGEPEVHAPADPNALRETAPSPAEAKATAAALFEETGPVTAKQAAAKVPTLQDSVADGDPVALHDYAVDLLHTGEKQRGVMLLKEAAGKGLVMAQYRLAKVYEKGEGVPRDIAQSRKYTEQAAIGGNVKAMHDLAVFYAEGDSGPQSYAAAVEWFRQAADLGLVDSQYNLAVLYEQGLGVSQDKGEAAFWFDVAGRSGDADGARRSRGLYAEMDQSAADAVRKRARAFSAKAPIARANGEFGRRPWDAATPALVTDTQRLLDRLGYRVSIDGRLTASTVDAIKAFETDNNLPVTGEATNALIRQLQAATLNAGG